MAMYDFAEQAYRVERGLGVSTPQERHGKIEVMPSPYRLTEVSCDIKVVFPTIRDPDQYQQTLVTGLNITSWDELRGNFGARVFYQGPAIDFDKYFRSNNA